VEIYGELWAEANILCSEYCVTSAYREEALHSPNKTFARAITDHVGK
jgi:hypothetical protein